MKRIIYPGQDDERIIDWVMANSHYFNAGFAKAIAVEDKGELIAGVVFHNFKNNNITLSIASKPEKHWSSHEFLKHIFRYVFDVCKCNRATAQVSSDNTKSIRYVEHLGFVREGAMREAGLNGQDILIYGMLRKECRFINEVQYAKAA